MLPVFRRPLYPDRVGASSATISRVRRAMLDNGAGGVMQEVIRREAPRVDEEKEA